MRRVVVVVFVAGCFSRPQLANNDGGGGDDGSGGDGGGDDAAIDGPIIDGPDPLSCHYEPKRTLLTFDTPATGPWISADYKTVFYVDDTAHKVRQAFRSNVNSDTFDSDTVVMSNVSTDPDPAFTPNLLHMYYRTASGGTVRASRANTQSLFLDDASNSALALVNSAGDGANTVSEGPWLSPDERTILFVSGTNQGGMTYASMELYVAQRTSSTATFQTPKKLAISVANRNDCCPTFANGLVMWERPIQQFVEIAAATWDGDSSFGSVAMLPFPNSFGQPALSEDGARLLYVEFNGSDRTIKEAERVCP